MNPTLRKFLQAGMSACSLFGLTTFFRRRNNGACILMYHGFIAGKPEGIENHSRLHLDIEDFRHTAKMLAKNYNVIPLQQLVDMMQAGRPVPPNTVVLTFDDGYASNYHLALPVLEEYCLHATVFASTGFIEGENYQWPDRIEYAIGHCRDKVLHLDFPGLPESLNLSTLHQRKKALVLLDSVIKLIPQDLHLDSLKHIEDRAGAALADDANPPAIYQPMTWQQVREMENSAHASIGSHTHIHAILGNCPIAFARQDMIRCTELLREKGGVENPIFAYPNGEPGDYNEETRELLKDLGYTVALTTVTEFNQPNQDLMELKRMGTPLNGYQADSICSGLFTFVKESITKSSASSGLQPTGRLSSTNQYQQTDAKPKVLHILADVMPGGMETLLLNLARQAKLSGSCDNVISVVQMGHEEGSLKPSLEKVAGFHDLKCDSFFSFDFIKKFRALLREVKPDVVHCWSHDSGVVAGAVARYLHNTKVTWAIHSLDLPSRGAYTPLRFNVLKALVGVSSRFVPHRIISCSDTATLAHVGFGYPLARCLTIDNGIDTDRYKINPQIRLLVRDQLGISESAPVVGYVGRSHPVKRLEDFFAAAAILMEKCPEMHFMTLGFSVENLYHEAKMAYDQLPDPSRMHILGRHPDPENYIPAFDVTALTSESEALPMVLMESLACGVPCVSTHVGSASRVVGPHGKCVPALRPDLMADALLSQLNAASQSTVSTALDIRRRCLDHFSIIVAEKHYGDCYKQLANPRLAPIQTEGSALKTTRIIHLVNDVGYGGAQVLLKRLSIGLKENGFEQCVVSVLPLEKTGALAPEFEKAGIPVLSLGISGPLSGLRGLVRFAAMIREQKPDLIQTWLFHSALIGELAALLSMRNPKTLWSIHHTLLGKESSKFTTRVIHRILAWISPVLPEKIIYCSKAGRDLHRNCGFDGSKSELIFNGTDTNAYRPDPKAKAALRNELGIPTSAPLIGMAGRYHPQKDFPNLLRAFAIVQQAVPDAHLLACGPGVSRDTVALRELADACPSPGQVHLIGPRRDMAAIYPALTLGALSSCEGEAFPLVLGEAMACGVPCVATDVGDSALIIGDTGRVVSPRNPQALAAEMISLLQLPGNEFDELRKAARQRVRQKFALDTYVNAHASLYNRLSGIRKIYGSGQKQHPPTPVLMAPSQTFIPKAEAKAPAA